MDYQIAFYIHHHGSGHIMSALSIAKAFSDKTIAFLGSNLSPYKSIIPHRIKCIHLPLDIAAAGEKIDERNERCKNFLYAPLNIAGIRDRNHILTSFFATHPSLLFIVDTSPEIVALARLCSVPVVVIQQHGKRNDLAHLLAYDSAVKIVALFPEEIHPDCPGWVKEKTLYAGGLSRYKGSDENKTTEREIGIFVGSGGTSIDFDFISHLARETPNHSFKAIGKIEVNRDERQRTLDNLNLTGLVADPQKELETCSIIIGNCGHNTVMEVATLNKRFICVPEDRPFFEQLDKAEKIEQQYGVKVVLPENLFTTNWRLLIDDTLKTSADWKNMVNPNATNLIRSEFDKLAKDLF